MADPWASPKDLHDLGEDLAYEIGTAHGPEHLAHVVGGFMSGGGFWDDVGDTFKSAGHAIIDPNGFVRGTLLPAAAAVSPFLGPLAPVVAGAAAASGAAKQFGYGLSGGRIIPPVNGDGRQDNLYGPRDFGGGFWDDVGHGFNTGLDFMRDKVLPIASKVVPFFAPETQGAFDMANSANTAARQVGLGLFNSVVRHPHGELVAHHVLGGLLSGAGEWGRASDPTGAKRMWFNSRLLRGKKGRAASATPNAAMLARGRGGTVGGMISGGGFSGGALGRLKKVSHKYAAKKKKEISHRALKNTAFHHKESSSKYNYRALIARALLVPSHFPHAIHDTATSILEQLAREPGIKQDKALYHEIYKQVYGTAPSRTHAVTAYSKRHYSGHAEPFIEEEAGEKDGSDSEPESGNYLNVN